MNFAKEGWQIVVPVMLIGIVGTLVSVSVGYSTLAAISIALIVCSALILLFFRDPDRKSPREPDLVLAPADGRVLLTEDLSDGRKRIAIFLSVLNVHINRAPVSGVVTSVTYRAGKYFNAASEDAAERNARVDVSASTQNGTVAWCQVSGLIARKISCKLSPSDRIVAGQRFGLIYFGSRMEVYLPARAEYMCSPGMKVRAGETIIARFIS